MEDGRMYGSMHSCKRKSKEERIEVRTRVREGRKERWTGLNERKKEELRKKEVRDGREKEKYRRTGQI